MKRRPTLTLRGVEIHKAILDAPAQAAMRDALSDVLRAAPLFRPETRRGQKMSVRMTSAGQLGWVSDRRGYRYEPRHPAGMGWPPIPDCVLGVWRAVTGLERAPDSCLVNYYDADAKMGLHQDRDEADLSWPVVSISLGDDALFRIGSVEKGGKTESIWLSSGDVAVLGGPARLVHHGIDRIRAGSSSLLARGGRINVTLRVAG